MKNTLILCILSALIAAGITYYIMREKDGMVTLNERQNEERHLNTIPKNIDPFKWKSDTIPIKVADAMIESFASDSGFFIPTAWTFMARDMKDLVKNLDKSDRVKMYAAVKKDDIDVRWMTLIVLANKADEDVTKGALMYEYADPCPPKCGISSPVLLSSKGCYGKWIESSRGFSGDCGKYR
jgi:hypothetical protein